MYNESPTLEAAFPRLVTVMTVQYWKLFSQGWEIEINKTPTLETVFSRLENKTEVQYRKNHLQDWTASNLNFQHWKLHFQYWLNM